MALDIYEESKWQQNYLEESPRKAIFGGLSISLTGSCSRTQLLDGGSFQETYDAGCLSRWTLDKGSVVEFKIYVYI